MKCKCCDCHSKRRHLQGENKVDVDLTKADNGSSLEPKPLKCDKGENESQENNESTDAETTSKNEEPVVDRNVECLLYKEFHTALESPLLGWFVLFYESFCSCQLYMYISHGMVVTLPTHTFAELAGLPILSAHIYASY